MGRLLSSRLLILSVWIGTLTYDRHDITLTRQKIGETVDSTTNIYNFVLVFHLNLRGHFATSRSRGTKWDEYGISILTKFTWI